MACVGNAAAASASIVSAGVIPTPPPYTPILGHSFPKKLHYRVGHRLEGQNLPRGADLRRGFGHAVDHAAGLILGNGVPPSTAQDGQPFGAVPSHAGEQHASGLGRPTLSTIFDETFEEHVHRRPVR